MTVLLTPPYLQFLDANGNPLVNGKIHTYAAGTTTRKATYTDDTGLVQADNPIILDSAGRATIWIAGAYKFVVEDSTGSEIRTTDNVNAFNTTAATNPSYFESFSGNGSQTVFTTSQSLGTDEKAIMVFVDNGGSSTTTNTPFFQKFTSIAAQTVFTVSQDMGTDPNAIQVFVLSGAKGYDVLSNTQYTISGTTLTLTTSPGAVTDAVYLFKNPILSGTYTKGFQILNINAYTISGTTLTMAVAPTTGTNNIMVFAPSLLLGAASSAASAADSSATAAGVSATNALASEVAAAASAVSAANQAAALSGTSATSNTIGTGTKSFTTQTGKLFNGENVRVYSSANINNYMDGIATYSGTSLSVAVTATGGTGTLTDWVIKVNGNMGVQGVPGSAMPIATAGGTIDAITANYTPDITLTNFMLCAFVSLGANATTTPTFTPDGLTTRTIVKRGGQALVAGDIGAAGSVHILEYNLASTRWELLNPCVNVTLTGTEVLTNKDLTSLTNTFPANGWISLGNTTTVTGTSKTVTGIPATANEVQIVMDGVSTSGTSPFLLQAGTSGGVVSSGYVGMQTNFTGAGSGTKNNTAGAGGVYGAGMVAAQSYSGKINLARATGNNWNIITNMGANSTTAGGYGVFTIALGAALDRINLTTEGGADTFDLGSFTVYYRT